MGKDINWQYFDEELGKHYQSDFGRPAKPIRLMVSLLILKHLRNVNCISKGKDHKKYEFGIKVSILRTKTNGVIVGALSFEKNVYDGITLEPAIKQYQN